MKIITASEIARWSLALELRRVLMLLKGEDWATAYEELVIDSPDLPTAEELEFFHA